MTKNDTEGETAMRLEPKRIRRAVIRIDTLRPKDSMELFAAMLPRRPPTEYVGERVSQKKNIRSDQ